MYIWRVFLNQPFRWAFIYILSEMFNWSVLICFCGYSQTICQIWSFSLLVIFEPMITQLLTCFCIMYIGKDPWWWPAKMFGSNFIHVVMVCAFCRGCVCGWVCIFWWVWIHLQMQVVILTSYGGSNYWYGAARWRTFMECFVLVIM